MNVGVIELGEQLRPWGALCENKGKIEKFERLQRKAVIPSLPFRIYMLEITSFLSSFSWN